MHTRTLVPQRPIDLVLSLGPVRRGRGDPCTRFAADGVWRATRTPDGPGTVHLRAVAGRIEAEAWGPGAAWLLDAAPTLVGDHDRAEGFEPHHRIVARLHHHMGGLRMARTGAVVEALLPSICEQKVTSVEARRAWHEVVRRWGSPAPGPAPLLLPPEPSVLAGVAYPSFHELGIERRRAETIRRACAQAGRLDALADADPIAVAARLTAVAGVGPWTAAEVGIVALGDADAVSVGDYHLPHQVCFGLAGERRGSDERMLELLEPYRGHRGRVLRLLVAGGVGPPRRGPRMPLRSIAAI